MDCKKFQNKIDNLIYTRGMQLDLPEQAHLEECIDCQKYYADALKAVQLMQDIQQWDPVLDNPEELTESIMKSISQKQQSDFGHSLSYRLVTRFLAAAVVALLLTLGIEQYLVLNKMQLLETKLGKVQQAHHFDKNLINEATIIDIKTLLNNDIHGFNLEKFSMLIRLNRVKHLNFTSNDFNRYIDKDNSIKASLKKETHIR